MDKELIKILDEFDECITLPDFSMRRIGYNDKTRVLSIKGNSVRKRFENVSAYALVSDSSKPDEDRLYLRYFKPSIIY